MDGGVCPKGGSAPPRPCPPPGMGSPHSSHHRRAPTRKAAARGTPQPIAKRRPRACPQHRPLQPKPGFQGLRLLQNPLPGPAKTRKQGCSCPPPRKPPPLPSVPILARGNGGFFPTGQEEKRDVFSGCASGRACASSRSQRRGRFCSSDQENLSQRSESRSSKGLSSVPPHPAALPSNCPQQACLAFI